MREYACRLKLRLHPFACVMRELVHGVTGDTQRRRDLRVRHAFQFCHKRNPLPVGQFIFSKT